MLAVDDDRTAARLRLLGPLRLTTAGGVAVEIPSRRARAILAYLALSPDLCATRERLCGLLWSDRGEAQARASLRQCLLDLRGCLANANLDLLSVGRQEIRLRADRLSTDVEDIETALNGSDLTSVLNGLGDNRLLEDLEIGGLFEDWRRVAGERLERAIASAVETRLEALTEASNWARSLALAESYLRRDPLDEMIAATAIRAHIALGAPGAARRQYQMLEAAMARELGVQPGAAVREALAFTAEEPRATAEPDTAASPPPSPTHRAAQRGPPPLPDRPSIAVLPFKNLSGDAEQDYFADAITRDIIHALSRWRSFFVIDEDSSFVFHGADLDARHVGFDLGVRYILKGNVQRSGKQLRVGAGLIDAADGSYLWSEKFDRALEDVFQVQDELTEHVAAAIEPAIIRGEGLRAARKKVNDFSALDCFYRGVWHLDRMSPEDDAKALELFAETISRDPELPLGYIGLARAHYGRAVMGSSSDAEADFTAALQAARTAINLDPMDAHGHFAAAGASLYLGDHSAALQGARRAISLNPSFGYAHYRLGQALIFSGRPAEAIQPLEHCLRLSPFDTQAHIIIETLALAAFQSHDYEGAIEHACLAIDMNHARANVILAAALVKLGRGVEAGEAYARARANPAPQGWATAAPYIDSKWRDHLRSAYRMAAPPRTI